MPVGTAYRGNGHREGFKNVYDNFVVLNRDSEELYAHSNRNVAGLLITMHPELHGSAHTSNRRRRGEGGETLVEFALALTVFLMTVLGTMELGIGVFRYNMMSDLAQEGSRWAAV